MVNIGLWPNCIGSAIMAHCLSKYGSRGTTLIFGCILSASMIVTYVWLSHIYVVIAAHLIREVAIGAFDALPSAIIVNWYSDNSGLLIGVTPIAFTTHYSHHSHTTTHRSQHITHTHPNCSSFASTHCALLA